ncbi:hypothetical protein [Cryobacterium luteum]|uniref:Uncharacterized protein n=1 Tax=Cryobacterium luteum TaxID=1424661 RepID=A0A1H8ATW0_9MICO|nr:hypothetical protein [Cryobacterium luteum]TFB88617.1 hypothetical protein E3O10_12625 [Cryobacterium luteum]SEM73404.1 hypothetical protein SAMN05216281_101307 [Cryobacterium luteum]
MGAAPRHVLAELLKPLLPLAWRIVPYQVTLDSPATVVVMLKQTRIERTAAAPQGAHDIGFTVTISSPHDDFEKAEDALDDQVNTLIHALDGLGIAWTTAEKVLDGTRLAYDITLTLISKKE